MLARGCLLLFLFDEQREPEELQAVLLALLNRGRKIGELRSEVNCIENSQNILVIINEFDRLRIVGIKY